MKAVLIPMGFLVVLSNVSAQCSTCLKHKCHKDGKCISGCIAGYVEDYCEQECPPNCLNRNCYVDRNVGTITCSDGCPAGFCGAKCSVQCPAGCVTCDRSCRKCNVTLCPEGRYGVSCTGTCNPNYEKCDTDSGICIKCKKNFYGDQCEESCPKCLPRAREAIFKCQSGCDICSSRDFCPPGSYGSECQHTCSKNCGLDNNTKEHNCNRATGECSTGCQPGYYGRTCNYTCSKHCVSGKCNRHGGSCTEESNIRPVLVVASLICCSGLVVLVVLVLFLIKRKRSVLLLRRNKRLNSNDGESPRGAKGVISQARDDQVL